MWEKELEIIESLEKLYPEINDNLGRNTVYDDCFKAWWVSWLCTEYLKQRISSLEEFLKENNWGAWCYYKVHFNITDEQCGKGIKI